MGNIHFGSAYEIEELFFEQADCGTRIGELSEFSLQWETVTCKRCLRSREKIETALRADEENILYHMGGMVDFYNRENNPKMENYKY